MRIRMIKSQRGADDGFTLREYVAGVEYDLSGTPRAEELAQVFVREGWAAEVGAVKPAAVAAPVEAKEVEVVVQYPSKPMPPQKHRAR